MKAYEITKLMKDSDAVEALTRNFTSAVFMHLEDSISKFVRYRPSTETGSLDFSAHLCHIQVLARFGFVRLEGNGHSLGGEYTFCHIEGDKESELPFKVRLALGNHVLFPDGEYKEIPVREDEDVSADIKNTMSQLLLSYAIGRMETFKP